MMKLLDRNVKAKDIVRMIDARIDAMHMHYAYAVNNKESLKAEAYAEAKWQLAEFKMQFVDLLSDQLNEELSK